MSTGWNRMGESRNVATTCQLSLLGRCRGLLSVGGCTSPNRSRMGVCGAWSPRKYLSLWEYLGAGRCRCADEIAGCAFHTHASWRTWLNGGGRSPDGQYSPSSWLTQMEEPTPAAWYLGDVSWCGIYGKAGQVREWCADWYDPEYYMHSPRLNPQGPDQSWPGYTPHRVLRREA
jgi:hypothetical protein